MKSTDTPLSPCWACGSPNDAASDLEGDAEPKPGDISICIQCGAPAVFTETLTLREPTNDEVVDILHDEGAVLHMLAVAMMHGRVSLLDLSRSRS